MGVRLFILFASFFVISCGSVSDADADAKEWEKNPVYIQVSIHYRNLGELEKLKATEFIFSNISGHFYLDGQYFSKYDRFFHLLDNYNKQGISKRVSRNSNSLLPEIEKQWSLTLQSIRKSDYATIFKSYDGAVLSAQYFIENIDEAFHSWKSEAWAKHVSFDDFCEYILPYRVFNEKPERWRPAMKTKYAWANSIASDSPIIIADTINKEIEKWFKFSELFYNYPFDLGYSRLMQGQVGGCSHMVTVTTYALRSMGIPCAVDYVPNYGNRSLGHTWNVVFDQTMEAIPFNGASTEWLEMGYIFHKQALDVKIPKVLRKTYAIQHKALPYMAQTEDVPGSLKDVHCKDVTAEYMPVSDIPITVKQKGLHRLLYLCIFDNRNWVPVAWSIIEEGKALFGDMGRDIVYLPAFYENGKIVPAGYPLILQKDGTIEEVRKYKGRAQSAKLFYKYPPALTGENDTTNAILAGDQYELFYWDNTWVSLGVKTTIDKNADIDSLGFDYKKTLFFSDVDGREFLFYENVPVGTLFLLHNHSRGKEERIFTIENSAQIWW